MQFEKPKGNWCTIALGRRSSWWTLTLIVLAVTDTLTMGEGGKPETERKRNRSKAVRTI